MTRRYYAHSFALSMVLMVGAQIGVHAQTKAIQTTPTTQPGSAPVARKLTMDEAIATALTKSKTLQLAAEAVTRAQGKVAESRAAFMPSLSATATATHLDEGTSVAIVPNEPAIPLVKQDQKSVGVVASLPIDITGLIGTAVQASQFQEIATRLDYNKARAKLVLDVKNAYFDTLRAKAYVQVAEVALKNAQDRQATAQSYLDAGTGTKFDVLRAQTEVANAQQNLIAAKNRVNLANAVLANVLNLDQNTPIDTAEAANDGASPSDFNAALSEAYKLRPEIFQADANISAARKGVKLAERSLLPSLGLAWNYSYTPDASGFSPKTTSWNAVAQLSIPLFDQGVGKARIKQARVDTESALIAKQSILDGVALDVRQNYLALVEATDRLNVTNAALAQADEQYRLARVRFEAGVTAQQGTSPLVEISDAQAALTQAQTNQVNAQYDQQNAKARLESAIGRYAYDAKGGPGVPAPTAGGKK